MKRIVSPLRIRMCTIRDPRARYQEVDALLEDLGDYSSRPGEVGTPSPGAGSVAARLPRSFFDWVNSKAGMAMLLAAIGALGIMLRYVWDGVTAQSSASQVETEAAPPLPIKTGAAGSSTAPDPDDLAPPPAAGTGPCCAGPWRRTHSRSTSSSGGTSTTPTGASTRS